jgi:hypothetical protein
MLSMAVTIASTLSYGIEITAYNSVHMVTDVSEKPSFIFNVEVVL